MDKSTSEHRFDAAVKYTSTTKTLKPTQEEQLQLYAHFKQATIGPCNTPKPSFWEIVAKTKWEAWKSLGDLSKEEARIRYIALVSKLAPNWEASSSSSSSTSSTSDSDKTERSEGGGGGGGGGAWGPVFSTPTREEESEADKAKEKDICYWASMGDEQKLVSLLESGVSINWKDSEDRTPLHWICDRGHDRLLDLLLTSKKYTPDLNLRDADGMTPLHYASLCGRAEMVTKLLAKGADPNVTDEDGSTPLDMADDASVKAAFAAAGSS
eukprot:TRINITY_DN7220_c0_g1_i1.p1 TRINITY_DN7220_c0_g1~~TRINITY_DN7220_c0_g1_i1.p1  ORF type:complete len:281 (+),score=86.21 TRINITY_DN7220_c0_g1_i1:40-843(+)